MSALELPSSNATNEEEDEDALVSALAALASFESSADISTSSSPVGSRDEEEDDEDEDEELELKSGATAALGSSSILCTNKSASVSNHSILGQHSACFCEDLCGICRHRFTKRSRDETVNRLRFNQTNTSAYSAQGSTNRRAMIVKLVTRLF